MGQGESLDGLGRQNAVKGLADEMRNKIGNQRHAGDQVPVRAEEIQIAVLDPLPLLVHRRALQVIIPGQPVEVRAVPYLGIIGTQKMVMGVDQPRYNNGFIRVYINLTCCVVSRYFAYLPIADMNNALFYYFLR